LANAARASGAAQIIGCHARSAESRERFAAEHGCTPFESLDELLASDIDGVLIATPHTTHTDLVIASAEAGKHVFVDKPLTLTVAEADRAIAGAENAGVVLQVGHNRRRQPANRRIKELIDAGELGGLLQVDSTHAAPLLFNPNLAPWRRKLEEAPVGGMAALGIHQVDTFHYLAGPMTGVYARSTRLLPEGEVDDTSSILFQFESGIQGHLFTSMATGPIVEVTVHGTEAVARNTGDGASLSLQRRGSTDQDPIPIEALDTIVDEVAEFAAAIWGEAKPETDGVEGRRAVVVLEAIVESAAGNRWVEVAYPA
jgi:predicted dehydrogenase